MIGKTLIVYLLCTTLGHDALAWSGNVRFFGATLSNYADPNQTFREGVPFSNYFNFFTEENDLEWQWLERYKGSYLWGGTVNDYNYAKSHGYGYQLMALLITGQGTPNWTNGMSDSAIFSAWQKYVQALKANMPDADMINVLNEPLHANGAPSWIVNSFGGTGSTGWDWLINMFKYARSLWPNAILGCHEYTIERMFDWGHQNYIDLYKALKNAGLTNLAFMPEGYWGDKFPMASPGEVATGLADMYNQTTIPVYVMEFSILGSDPGATYTQYILSEIMNSPGVYGVSTWNPAWEGQPFGSDGMNWMIQNIPLPLTTQKPPPPTTP
jgi:endo-1,4-beta-xylanase